MTALTLPLMQKMWPHGDSKISGLIEGLVASSAAVFAKYGIDSQLTVAHAMAQFSHECGAGTEVVENLNYRAEALHSQWPKHFTYVQAQQMAHQPQLIANQAYNGRMGNREGSDDGWNYRGRGPAQTTGRDAYDRLGKLLGLDLLNHPELINDPAHFLECGVADFVTICGCLPFAKADDVVKVTEHLNGGRIGLSERQAWLARWKAALANGPVGV